MDLLDLADWRQRMAALYLSDLDLAAFRTARDDLFRTHPQSPIVDRASFTGLRYFAPDPAFVADCPVRVAPSGPPLEIDTGGEDGVITYQRAGVASTPWGELTLFWISAYGGGLFLPFRDATAPVETYGAGRYLADTVKGTFGRGLTLLDSGSVRLDFNYAYNPSCVYDDRWACPLAPPENRLSVAIRAGELNYH
ncbi:uncharacterized protein (DUF1684 family) [Catenuloplanes nepalensis]|uniref:Uncharacterized protein (DUF1684 family) n=1 Tax=Catenuloplanes nepalensis TaxID=587533 RepID=A0ABT9MYA3_9ACTN|nr:DUF1684 domain-containing protein [Catenuloplanes nepalensis]MDP9796422.1 uncharacterized protein (DUF1684 family) [Catenuloplanes nepalensis]